MYASATDGTAKNNNQFSSCSRQYIGSVLRAVFYGNSKENCFKSSAEGFCGNKIVESNNTSQGKPEKCDCGYKDECDKKDQCCHGRGDGDESQWCQLKVGKQCSPTAGLCCAHNCTFVKGIVCKKASKCAHESRCDGNSEICPKPKTYSK